MAYRPHYCVHAPASHGMTYDEGTNDPTKYKYLAYCNSENQNTFFCAIATKPPAWDKKTKTYSHDGLVSIYQKRDLPVKPDVNVFAIPWQEAMRLKVLETLWWRDWNAFLESFPGDETGASAWAHSLVVKEQRGEGLDEKIAALRAQGNLAPLGQQAKALGGCGAAGQRVLVPFGSPSCSEAAGTAARGARFEAEPRPSKLVNGEWTGTQPAIDNEGAILNCTAGGQGTFYFSEIWGQYVWIGQAADSKPEFWITTAPHPEGPWIEPQFVTSVPTGNGSIGAYTMQAHPWLNPNPEINQLYVTYTIQNARYYESPLYLIEWD